MAIHRNPRNPILTRHDVPAISPTLTDISSVFNPSAVKFDNKYLLLLRVQTRGRETRMMLAESEDGVRFIIQPRVIVFRGIERIPAKYYHVYDARITPIDDKYYIVFAIDFDSECRLGLAVTTDFVTFDFLDLISPDDSRNGVLFPERIADNFLLLERPNTVALSHGPVSGDTIVLSKSADMWNWQRTASVLQGRWHYWDERIGAGPAPVKTRHGWLLVYHGVATHFASANIYQAGVALLDLQRPQHVIARSRLNILEPRELYELIGQVPNVVFPSGLIVEQYDSEGYAIPSSEFKLYYGAADTVVGLLEGTVQDLLNACYEGVDDEL
ncbi:MAG: glycoside hydrolase family 130 protein [bacterium]|nr:glycoside hydrolase family 130 protein [bacterium]